MRVRLDLSYDGTDFSGWARQPGRRTVQGVLQDALAIVLRQPAAALTVAGRTDAGVHASGQVAHLDVPAAVWADAGDRLVRALAGVLPPDVRVSAARAVPASFDARFGALWRRYEYRIGDAPGGVAPLRRGFVVGWRAALDVPAMAEAAARLVGLHDFVAFCRRREGATTTRELQDFRVTREGGAGAGRDAAGEILIEVRADAFCHSMVRSLVGALGAVGEGRRGVEWPASLLTRGRRADDVPVAPPHGLCLVEVGYPGAADDAALARVLAERAERTRARR